MSKKLRKPKVKTAKTKTSFRQKLLDFIAKNWINLVTAAFSGFAVLYSCEANKIEGQQFTLVNQSYVELDRDVTFEGPNLRPFIDTIDPGAYDSVKVSKVILAIKVKNIGKAPLYYNLKKYTVKYNESAGVYKPYPVTIVYPGTQSAMHLMIIPFADDFSVLRGFDSMSKDKFIAEVLVEYWDEGSTHVKVVHKQFEIKIGKGKTILQDIMSGDKL